ncbi:hypothetical protein M0R45_030734 [Rubus argutus]|uniref:Uncharacterized protein n=1 Tax=Rubus argutus TaxID=59490 RepID=A0AAW1WC77_RUBAR
MKSLQAYQEVQLEGQALIVMDEILSSFSESENEGDLSPLDLPDRDTDADVDGLDDKGTYCLHYRGKKYE